MLPSLERLAALHEFACRRYNLLVRFDRNAMRQALDEAGQLATTERDEPAALFYALARWPRALGKLWQLFPPIVAAMHAQGLGLWLPVDRYETELARLRIGCITKTVTYADVRAWFAAHYAGA